MVSHSWYPWHAAPNGRRIPLFKGADVSYNSSQLAMSLTLNLPTSSKLSPQRTKPQLSARPCIFSSTIALDQWVQARTNSRVWTRWLQMVWTTNCLNEMNRYDTQQAVFGSWLRSSSVSSMRMDSGLEAWEQSINVDIPGIADPDAHMPHMDMFSRVSIIIQSSIFQMSGNLPFPPPSLV